MQGFVKDRQSTNSPHNALANAQHVPKTDRQAVGANARVSIKNGLPSQRRTPVSGALGRGSANAQNSSAVLQNPRRVHSAQGHTQKRDPYDTDAESLDTTIDQSVVQLEGGPQNQQQYHQNGQVFDLGVSGDVGESNQGSEEPEHPYEEENEGITQDDEDFLESKGLGHLHQAQKIEFLKQAGRLDLPAVEGDSYPTTTNGEPSEMDGIQEPSSGYRYEGRQSSPFHQHPNVKHEPGQSNVLQPTHRQQKLHMPVPRQSLHKPSQLFEQSAQLRDQTRANVPSVQQPRQNFPQHRVVPQSGQPPTYNQFNAGVAPAVFPIYSNPYQNTHVEANNQQYVHRQQPGPSHVQFQFEPVKPIEPPAPAEYPFSAQMIPKQTSYQPPVEQAAIEELQDTQIEDYDAEALFNMKYESLKSESFDTNPRAKPLVLTEEDAQKPLPERLVLVQKNLTPDKQANFFSSLPTSEWEDAGDWFLDQFQSIVQRTKQARQKKRKLAQEFEEEVEKRHRHVAKKQQQVEQAMEKMKAQGESLVPRSPRPSKSPRPRRN
ncbi:hypothetical protein COCMIDRAFT_27299 [Bipolaris oryzae ATCC 44560]|uniref:Extracellular mutant protein 11 C-terminal domain-containing protein n=1 Tax=Bipolaris oryzae ATCC 44560 TaxID=930090 RepID=W6YYA8_COCMI|nr:uncharacterized protein COCMIDRAFT_27299 [Bipolaris oryzae ATCC 44560]EUC44322.1 hypothetical protein COCMIDRAFT_27299 [Bipolaris oryzae ATCC 44560]